MAKPPNSDRHAKRAEEYRLFVKETGRSSRKRNGHDPNDRHYDPDFAKSVRRMDPMDFDAILRDGDDEISN